MAYFDIGITKSKLWNDIPFASGQAFMDLVIMANENGNNGEVITNKRELSMRWGYAPSHVQDFLRRMVCDGYIELDTHPKYTRIIIIDNHKYTGEQAPPITEKKKKVYYPQNPEINELFEQYAMMRKKHRKPLSDFAIEQHCKKLEVYCGNNLQLMKEVIETAIKKGRHNFYPVEGCNNYDPSKLPKDIDWRKY